MKDLYWGISSGHHDAALAVVSGDQILYASHAERYSRLKNDPNLHDHQIKEVLSFGIPTKICFFENPALKRKRYFLSGQWTKLFENHLKDARRKVSSCDQRISSINWVVTNHHRSHAAAGYYTSGFHDAIVVTCDAIGELETLTVYKAEEGVLDNRPLFSLSYPDSVGLFYSAITAGVGLKPNEEEFILMGMSAYGKPAMREQVSRWISITEDGFPAWKAYREFHLGVSLGDLNQEQKFNWAATAQEKIEDYVIRVFAYLACLYPQQKNWVFMGGVALNCVLNSKIVQSLPQGSSLHIFPSPGDSGSALGSILSHLNRHVQFSSPYLGTSVDTKIDIQEALRLLLERGILGIIQGRAEFGPRALGNRSLLADPRDPLMKMKLNEVKKREEFRPFAPVVRLEDLKEFFEPPAGLTASPYMQFVMKVRRPELMPAITHVDGTARVQTVTKETNPVIYELLTEWRRATTCPVLVNTSLNIKGDPLVNDRADAFKFEQQYGIKVLY